MSIASKFSIRANTQSLQLETVPLCTLIICFKMSHNSAVNKLICIEFASQLHKDFLSPSFNCLKQRTSICAASHLHVSTLSFLQLPYKAITWILSKCLQFSHILLFCAPRQSACWRSNDGPIKFQPESTECLFKVSPKCPTLPPPKNLTTDPCTMCVEGLWRPTLMLQPKNFGPATLFFLEPKVTTFG